jgi:hypothetical protein
MFKISRSNRLFQKSNILFLNRQYSTIKSSTDPIAESNKLEKFDVIEGKIDALDKKINNTAESLFTGIFILWMAGIAGFVILDDDIRYVRFRSKY